MEFKGNTSFYSYYKSLKRVEKKKFESEIEYNLLLKLRTTCNYNKDIGDTDPEEIREIRKLLDQFKYFNSKRYITYLEYFYNWLYHWNNFQINRNTFDKDIKFVKQHPKEWHRLLTHYVYMAQKFNFYKKDDSIYDKKIIEYIRNIAGKRNVNYKAIELALHRYKVSEGLIPPKFATEMI